MDMTKRDAVGRDTQNDLGSVPLFADCPPRDRKRLALLGTRVHVGAGRELTTAGSRGAQVLVVLSGHATCLVRGTEAASFGPGDFFGEVATLDGGPRTATVVADTDMDLVVFSRAEFERLVSASPAVARRILVAMARRLREANAMAVA